MLGYFELPEDEVPDENIWHHPERLDEWFEAVKQRRSGGMEPVPAGEDTDMTGNDYVRELMKEGSA